MEIRNEESWKWATLGWILAYASLNRRLAISHQPSAVSLKAEKFYNPADGVLKQIKNSKLRMKNCGYCVWPYFMRKTEIYRWTEYAGKNVGLPLGGMRTKYCRHQALPFKRSAFQMRLVAVSV